MYIVNANQFFATPLILWIFEIVLNHRFSYDSTSEILLLLCRLCFRPVSSGTRLWKINEFISQQLVWLLPFFGSFYAQSDFIILYRFSFAFEATDSSAFVLSILKNTIKLSEFAEKMKNMSFINNNNNIYNNIARQYYIFYYFNVLFRNVPKKFNFTTVPIPMIHKNILKSILDEWQRN